VLKKLKFIRSNKTKFGGAEVYLSRVSEELERQGIEHSLVHSSIPKLFPSWLRVILFNLQVCLVKKDSFYFSLERISCPDIYRAGDGVHKEFIKVENKSFLNPLHLVYLYLEKRCFENAKVIIANSHMVKKQIVNNYNIQSDKIEVIYNGINLEDFSYEYSFEKLTAEFNIQTENKPKIILFVGSGFARKGVFEFLQIIEQLKMHNILAFVIGKEKKIAYYKNLAIKLGIHDKVIFTGARNDVNDFYVISDIFLFPTHYEPFSNVVLEAMNFSNVVITTKQNGANEILDDNFIMKEANDFLIVEKILDLISNPSKIEYIKNHNKQLVSDFSIEKNATLTLELIKKVMNGTII